MAATAISIATDRGHLSYTPGAVYDGPDQSEPVSPLFFQGRTRRPRRICVTRFPAGGADNEAPALSRKRHSTKKLAGSREGAKRFLRSVVSSSNTNSTSVAAALQAAPNTAIAPSVDRPSDEAAMTQASPFYQRTEQPSVAGPMPSAISLQSLADDLSRVTGRSYSDDPSDLADASIAEEKPVASANGIAVYITLAEPLLFLQGYDQHDCGDGRATAMLRGSLVVKVTKTTKLKAISLNFCGKARTEWPEGIPPRKTEFYEEEIINRHTWPFFNAQFAAAEKSFCADSVTFAKDSVAASSQPVAIPCSGRLAFDQFARSASPSAYGRSTREVKRSSLQLNRSRSFGKSDAPHCGQSVAQKGYKTFYPGHYIYNFELPLDSHLPETIKVELGSVKYQLEAVVERSGTFRANLLGSREVKLIRAPSEGSLEQVEPIAISRNWEDQLHYDIVISGKSFPLGSQVPIAFKLTPLAKVQCHRIKIYVTENVEYYCSKKRVHRMEPMKKVHLFEKRADSASSSAFSGSSIRILSGGGVDYDHRQAAAQGDEGARRDTTSLLGNLNGDHNIGPTEMEVSVQLPSCRSATEKDKTKQLHFDTTFSNIQVHHWIKIVMRLSKPDDKEAGKRRHFEISIDSPLQILSCQATQANTSLPAYSNRLDGGSGVDSHGEARQCGCPGAARRESPRPYSNSLSSSVNSRSENSLGGSSSSSGSSNNNNQEVPEVPAAAHGGVQRPMHMLRAPSFSPPAFDDDAPPPAMITPPPQYDSIGDGLADYFSRLADEEADESVAEEHRLVTSRGRVNLPLSPGGRVNRSMDERRTWLPPGHAV
ncbi:MAG: hypothetical protein M1825_004924 [Sarcosagium campestre]|nr:MAG: hypothetical protein M1825_004924 [Sarcosagium campestre]